VYPLIMEIKSLHIKSMRDFSTPTPLITPAVSTLRQNTKISFVGMEFLFVVLTGDMGFMKTD